MGSEFGRTTTNCYVGIRLTCNASLLPRIVGVMVARDYKRYPRSGSYASGDGIRQWDRFDFLAMLAVVLIPVFAYYAISHYRAGRRMRSWVEVPAHIESVGTHAASGGRHTVNRIALR